MMKLLVDRQFYLPELSETDDDDEKDGKENVINVYDLSWRSAEIHLLIFVYIYFIKWAINY